MRKGRSEGGREGGRERGREGGREWEVHPHQEILNLPLIAVFF